jgi:hypothetical protein
MFDGKAQASLKAERTSVREHFKLAWNAAIRTLDGYF